MFFKKRYVSQELKILTFASGKINFYMSELQWFVLYTTSRSEKKVAKRLNEMGVEVFLPIVEELRQWSDRKKKVQKALFNGYVFVKTNSDKLWESLQVP